MILPSCIRSRLYLCAAEEEKLTHLCDLNESETELILFHIILFIQSLCLMRLRRKSVFARGGFRETAVSENETFGDYLEMDQELSPSFERI